MLIAEKLNQQQLDEFEELEKNHVGMIQFLLMIIHCCRSSQLRCCRGLAENLFQNLQK